MSEIGGRWTEGGGPDRLDLAIDRAVREMLDVEQPSGFRGRVLARIESPAPVVSAFRRKIFWLGAPLAAAAIVILAVLLPRERVEPQPPAPITTVGNQPSSSAPEAGSPALEAGSRKLEAGSGQPEAGSRKPAGSRQPAAGSLAVAASFEPAADVTPGIQPLEAIAPIQIAALTQESIAPAPIELRPLSTITEVPIAPLSLPERRD